MASGGGGGGAGVCNKRCRGSADDDDGETIARNKRCGGVGPSSARANDDGGAGAYMDDGARTSDDDGSGEDYMYYGYDDDDDGQEADERSEGAATEPRYVVLTEADLRARQDADTAAVAEVLCIQAGFAALLLRHFKWRAGRVQEEWFSDERRVRTAVGLPPPAEAEHGGGALVPYGRAARAEVCGVCFDTFPAGRTRAAAGCGHFYCDACWRGYVAAAVSEGPRCLALRCPDPSCSARVVLELVDAVLAAAGDADGSIRARYARFWLRSYVEESGGRVKWCGGAGCARAVELLGDGDAAAMAATDVFCEGGHGFCWACGEEAHGPVSCGTVRAWLDKNASDSETANWVAAHTKRCPLCRRPIEKNHGCNHMTCGAPCRHHFCWLCLDPWDNHRGCSARYDPRRRRQDADGQASAGAGAGEDGDDEEEARRRQAKASLDKYLYHYERWAGNGKSLHKALADADELERGELERMARAADVPAMELAFVAEAYRQIAAGRRVLRWAHAYAYFLFLDPDGRDAAWRDLFDDLQSQANLRLECLHSAAELERKYIFGGDGESTTVAVEAFRAYKEKVANLTGVTRKFMGNLVKAFKTNLPEVVVTPPAVDFNHIVNGPTMGRQTAGVGGTVSSVLNWFTQQENIANGSVQEHGPVQQPVRLGGHGGLLSNTSQFPPMNSNFFGEATTSMGPPNIGAMSPLQVPISNMISSGFASTHSVTFSMSAPGQPFGSQEMVQSTALGSFGSNTSITWDNSDIAGSSSQPNSVGLNGQAGINPLSSALNVPIGMHPNAQQPPPKYVKIWEGTLSGQRQGQPVFICKLESWSGTLSRTGAADWPETMQIVRLIAQEHMNNKQYVGKAEFLIFRTLNHHGFLGQLQEKKLCAVIQLPSQTLLLSMSEKAGRMIGMLFPENVVIFKPNGITQPSTVQQQNVQQQQQQQELLRQQQLNLQHQQQRQQNILLQQHQQMQQILRQQQMQHEQPHMQQQRLHHQQLQHQGQLRMFTREGQQQLLQEMQQQPRFQQQLHQQMQHQRQLRQQIQLQMNQQQYMQPQRQPLPQMIGTELGSDDDDASEDWVAGAGQHT